MPVFKEGTKKETGSQFYLSAWQAHGANLCGNYVKAHGDRRSDL